MLSLVQAALARQAPSPLSSVTTLPTLTAAHSSRVLSSHQSSWEEEDGLRSDDKRYHAVHFGREALKAAAREKKAKKAAAVRAAKGPIAGGGMQGQV